jgi:hypothetical protein
MAQCEIKPGREYPENKATGIQWPVLQVEQSNVWASKSVLGHGLP